MKLSRTGIILSALPSLAMLVLFYSLAIHMRYSLGAWPISIGNRGFPPALITHGELTWMFCAALACATVYIVPIAVLVCWLQAYSRRFVIYFLLYALFFGVSWGLMLLAPRPFLHWWRD